MTIPGLCRWTAQKCRRICCRSSFPLSGCLLSQQQRSFSLGGNRGIKLLGRWSSRGRSGGWLALLRNSSEELLLNARVYSSTTGDDKEASASTEDNDDPSNSNKEGITLYLSDEDLHTLTGGDPEIIKKVRFIQMEHEILLQEGAPVPLEPIPLHRWDDLLSNSGFHQRRKYYYFLYDLEVVKRLKKARRERELKELENYLSTLPPTPALGTDEDRMIYGLARNTLFLKLQNAREYSFYENRLIQAMKFGPAIVIDCGYDQCMTTKANRSCSSQIELAFAWNRLHPRPFDLHLCNLQQGTRFEKYMTRRMPTLYNPVNPLNVTNKSYLDVFPKERLVYLTPHTREDLVEFDEDKVYIIPGMVDLDGSKRYCMAKAKREGIPMKKLPLEQYLQWGQGRKSLTFDVMVKILLDANYHKDWNIAFKHIPRRKLFNINKNVMATHNDNPPHQKRIHPPTFITRTSPKTILYDNNDELDPRKSHYANRVNLIEDPLPTDRDRYQRPERSLYYQNSISNNFSGHNYSDFEENNVRRERSYERKFQNSGYTKSDESQQSKRREFNVQGFLNPKK